MSAASTCNLEPLLESLQFRNGSLSKLSASRKEADGRGCGTFTWVSGHKYVGEFKERERHGYGVQVWPDGSQYEGYFIEDLRHGSGRHSWHNKEVYEGEYVADKKHGPGVYRWPSGAYFSGKFKLDCKEGPGVYVSAEGNKFEGVYNSDVRNGEGVLTYTNGQQDVGVWKGTKLVQLRFAISEALFDPSSDNHPLRPSCSSLESPDLERRQTFGPKGPLEVASEELIRAAACGVVAKVTAILKLGAVHVDVVDRNGHSALFTAAIHCHSSVINALLDNSADVNKLDATGVSALNACHHLLYSSLPQVQTILRLLPPLKPHPSQFTPPPLNAITNLTDCTLHTSDFLSTPHTRSENTYYLTPPISLSTYSEYLGSCGVSTNRKAADFSESLSDSEASESTLIEAQPSTFSSVSEPEPLRTVHFPSTNNLSARESCGTNTDVDRDEQCHHFSNETDNDGESLEEDSSGRNKSKLSNHHLALMTLRASPKQSLGFSRCPPTSDPSSLLHSHRVQCLKGPKQDVSLSDHEQPRLSLDQVASPISASTSGEVLCVSTTDPDLFYSEDRVATTKKKKYLNNVVSLRYISNEFLAQDYDQYLQSGREEHQIESENVKELFELSLDKTKNTKENGVMNISKAHDLAEMNVSNPLSSPGPNPGEINSLTLLPAQDSGGSSVFSSPRYGAAQRAKDSLQPTHSWDSSSVFSSSQYGAAQRVRGSLQPTHSWDSSSVFSSTQYGPIVSAAQSATLSYKGSVESYSTLTDDTSSVEHEQVQESSSPDSVISLLLQRGADPNTSQVPLAPLVYAIRSGSVLAIEQLLKRGADVNQCLPPEVGGHSPLVEAVSLVGPNPIPVVECLLDHGVDPNLSLSFTGDLPPSEECSHSCRPTSNREASQTKKLAGRCARLLQHSPFKADSQRMQENKADKCCLSVVESDTQAADKTRELKESCSVGRDSLGLLAGENQGRACYTPLHVACAHRNTSDDEDKELLSVIPAMVELLLRSGAKVDSVAKGQSPLSLAIINGHNKVIELLLDNGADPNLPLGKDVGTALCSLTTHSALRKRNGTASIGLIVKLMVQGANILQPVKVTGQDQTGTVVDFATRAFKEDKRLSCFKYCALSKTERARFRAWKKVVEHFINLFRCKALSTIAIEEVASQQRLCPTLSDKPINTVSTLSPPHKAKVTQTTSALVFNECAHPKTSSKLKKWSRATRSAGEAPYKTGIPSSQLPEHTLEAALDKVAKHHGDGSIVTSIHGDGSIVTSIHGDGSTVTSIPNVTRGERYALNKHNTVVVMASQEALQGPHLNILERAMKMFSPEVSKFDQTEDQVYSSGDLDGKHSPEELNKMEHTRGNVTCEREVTARGSRANKDIPSSVTARHSEWSLSSFCYECGRSAGVCLAKCSGCQVVSYCSKTCRVKSLKKGHKNECREPWAKKMTFSNHLYTSGKCFIADSMI